VHGPHWECEPREYVARVAREIESYCDWAGSSLSRSEFDTAAADLFAAIYGRDPDADEACPSDHVYAAIQAGLTLDEARRAAAVLARLW
jgi:hypothetical protein